MTTHAEIGGPWYRHSWPWFIVLLLGSTVIAGLVTVAIAFRGADSLVVDDYYQDGRAINQTFAADREAALREVSADVDLARGVSVALDILGEAPAVLAFELQHVTRAELDVTLQLERASNGRYTAADTPPAGTYYATLRPAGGDAPWRLRHRITLPEDHTFTLKAAP